MKTKSKIGIGGAFVAGFVALSACGVKGPPLPPVADTPADSDRAAVSMPAPSPTPVPSPTPKAKSKKRR